MKQINSIKNFKTSILGEVFQGILKQDIIQKGSSVSNCQIEPFFYFAFRQRRTYYRRHVFKIFSKKINSR